MAPRRRAADREPWIVRYWPILAFFLTWLVAGVGAFVHLEDHVKVIDARDDRQDGRMSYHWGQER